MRARLTPAGWAWLTYAAAFAGFVVACTGCSTPAPATAAQLEPAPGLRCWIGAELYRIDGRLVSAAPGWWSVRHLASDGRDGLWYVSADQLKGCAA